MIGFVVWLVALFAVFYAWPWLDVTLAREVQR